MASFDRHFAEAVAHAPVILENPVGRVDEGIDPEFGPKKMTVEKTAPNGRALDRSLEGVVVAVIEWRSFGRKAPGESLKRGIIRRFAAERQLRLSHLHPRPRRDADREEGLLPFLFRLRPVVTDVASVMPERLEPRAHGAVRLRTVGLADGRRASLAHGREHGFDIVANLPLEPLDAHVESFGAKRCAQKDQADR